MHDHKILESSAVIVSASVLPHLSHGGDAMCISVILWSGIGENRLRGMDSERSCQIEHLNSS